MTEQSRQRPTVGAAVLVANGPGGWDPPALLLTTPLVILRFRDGRTRLYASDADEPFFDEQGVQPIVVLQQVLHNIKQHLPAAGPKAGKPAFPVAVVAAAYEFGRWFSPHESAFRHADELEEDEFFASVFIDGYRPDTRGETERIGYAGAVPEGWMAGAPALKAPPADQPDPTIIPHYSTRAVDESELQPEVDRELYRAAIERIHEHLSAGDIYQANLTLPWKGRTARTPEDIFDTALKRGGANYGMTLLTPQGTVLSFSPELLLRRRGDDIQTRPIKGTFRIPNVADGVAQAREALAASEKDRAEHVMIVDLERNDLGRVCEAGSVKVDPLLLPVEHPTVMHLESWVKGKLRPDATLVDIFAAVFPGGSVTGAPKKRALEIISELESGPRGIYCGALGWIDADGDIELNLPIRTGLVRPDGSVRLHTGGGIVADSEWEREWEEMRDKARFFIEALKG